MRPDHPDPPVRVVRPLHWEFTRDPVRGRIVRLWSHKRQDWSIQSPWTGDIHRAIEAGAGFSGVVAALSDRFLDRSREWQRRTAGTYLYQLWDEGYLDLGFGDPPARLGVYAVDGELGRGAVGIAYRCRAPDASQVVVKRPWDWFAPMEVTERHLRREAETMAAVAHPRIVRLVATFQADGLFHLVRGFVDGEPLGRSPLAADALRSTAHGIVDVFSGLHAGGWLVVDTAPGNFLDSAKGPVLGDVGSLLRHENGRSVERTTPASPAYAAPELRTERHATIASDLYGLGRLLFALAVGRPPLAAWGPDDLRMRVDDDLLAGLIADLVAPTPSARPDLSVVRARLG